MALGMILWAPQAIEAFPSGCGGPACVNIGGFAGDTFNLGTWAGSGGLNSGAVRHCVFSNRPAAPPQTYNVTATGVGTPGGAFLLSGPGGDLPYLLDLREATNAGDWITMTSGVAENFPSLSEAVFDSCTNSANSANGQRARIRAINGDLQSFSAGIYTGTVRLDVETPVGSASDFEISGTITAEIAAVVRLLRLQTTFPFGTWNPDGAGDLVQSDSTVCVWSNHASKHYTVTATTGSGAFEILSGGNAIGYAVWWSDESGVSTVASSDAELTYGAPDIFVSDATATNCGGGNNASIVLAIAEDELSEALPGAYTGDLTVTIGVAP